MKKIFAWIEKNPIIAGIIIIGAAWLVMTLMSGPSKQRRAHRGGGAGTAGNAAAASGATGGMAASSFDTSTDPSSAGP